MNRVRVVLAAATLIIATVVTASPVMASADGKASQITPAAVNPLGEFTALTPMRILDTRDGTGQGGVAAPVGPGATIDVQITGQGGVPATGVSAVVLNATVTQPSAGGFLTIWPFGAQRPLISNLNYVPYQTVPNAVTVAVGDDGKVSVYNFIGTTHVVFDVVGYYADETGNVGSRFHGIVPARDFDTRYGTGGVPATPIGAGGTLTFKVTGTGGVPASGVTAVVMNVTVTQPTGYSHLTVYPGDVANRPLASNLNYVPGQTVPNLVIVRVPTSGYINFYNNAGTTHLLADVVGYYDGNKATEAGRLLTGVPGRIIDTRVSSPFPPPGMLWPEWDLIDTITNPNIGALVINVTVTQPTAEGFITVFPGDLCDVPLASNVNFLPNQTVPNLVMVRVGQTSICADEAGQVVYYNYGGFTHLIVDLFGYFTSSTFTLPLVPLTGATDVAAGTDHTCAIVAGGQVACWGQNAAGELGDGTIANRSSAVPVAGLAEATQVTASGRRDSVFAGHTCALVAGGAVKCWGLNSSGELGDGTTTNRPNPVSVSGLTGATQIAAGNNFTCALVAGGTVKCWGANAKGQLGDTTTTDSVTPVSVSGVTGATQIAVGAGALHVCALVAGGAVKCWGYNGMGQLGDTTFSDRATPVSVSGLTGATQIAAGSAHTCVLVAGGGAQCWGANSSGQLGDNTGFNQPAPVTVSGLTGATQITGGGGHTCVLVAGGAAKCWGGNFDGQVGDNSNSNRWTPVDVVGLTGATQIRGGYEHTCALMASGQVECWGDNGSGQVGDGTTMVRWTPVVVKTYGL